MLSQILKVLSLVSFTSCCLLTPEPHLGPSVTAPSLKKDLILCLFVWCEGNYNIIMLHNVYLFMRVDPPYTESLKASLYPPPFHVGPLVVLNGSVGEGFLSGPGYCFLKFLYPTLRGVL